MDIFNKRYIAHLEAENARLIEQNRELIDRLVHQRHPQRLVADQTISKPVVEPSGSYQTMTPADAVSVAEEFAWKASLEKENI